MDVIAWPQNSPNYVILSHAHIWKHCRHIVGMSGQPGKDNYVRVLLAFWFHVLSVSYSQTTDR